MNANVKVRGKFRFLVVSIRLFHFLMQTKTKFDETLG